MFSRALSIRLPRRITAHFLLFALGGLVWLGVGAIYVARSVSDNRSESASLRWLGRGSHRLVLAYLRDGDQALPLVVSETCQQSGANFCALVAASGKISAHSQQGFAGRPAEERGVLTDRWGDVVRVEYDDNGVKFHEYRLPVKAGTTDLGTFRLGVTQPSLWTYLRAGAGFAPIALIGPACCMAVGVVALNRLVRPVADIEQQLQQIATSPSVDSCQLSEVPAIGAAAMGWNRMVQRRIAVPDADALRERVRQSLEGSGHGRLDAVLNSIPDGVATTDAAGRLTYTNLPMAVLIGLNDVVGNRGDGGGVDQAPRMAEQLIKSWKLPGTDPLLVDENRDRPVISELSREETGQRRVVRVARHPICIVGGHFDTHVWLVRDVTQQKLAEEMRDQFVDTATHELRTPLANIKAYAETLALAEVIDIEQQKQFLNTINSEATRLARFVDDLLSVSSMELGSLSLNKQTLDLGRLLGEVLTKIRPQMAEKNLALEVVIPEKLPEPELDKDKISAVLINLLGNAVKYTPAGGRVAFRVHVADHNLEIHVEDTGVGIASDELPKVFDKFFRSSDPRVQEQTGTGLGLALAQEIVLLHGGRITAESEINKGSTFCVTLPIG